ncbi:unnamed protein product [Porites lobata]|uniref:Peptidase S1 domain-containing protein n=1 Tax=Porites lobata TaxID=104759 RepID=A0ABN8MW00_9CNID|nr:unnamed protein product [Porites lobata]
MKPVVLLFLCSLSYTIANPVCNTQKTEEGGCCHFPFYFDGYWFYSCTTHGWFQEWCSLTANYEMDGRWGNCLDTPVTTAVPTPDTPAYTPPALTTASPPSGGSCGNKPAGSRIVGGIHAQQGEWPWQAMLAQPGGSQFCGGSLISDRWVLTASHCVTSASASQIVVRMGAHMITDTAQEHQVEKIIMHESYNSPLGLAHDIALLKLTTAVTMGNSVGTVCLPDINQPLLSGKQCYITGWGTLTSGGNQPDQLMEASVPIVSQASCSNAYPGQIHDSMICAGLDAGGVDACQGDSGGPMVCEFNGKWYLEGATSWGYGCAVAGKYGVYAKVRYLKTWVENKMSSE